MAASQVGYEAMLKQLRQETINLSDDGAIQANPVFRSLAAKGHEVEKVLTDDFNKRPTRAVYLLLKRLGITMKS